MPAPLATVAEFPRLRQVCLAVPQLAPARAQLRALFALDEPFADPHVAPWGLENAVFTVGRQFIELIAPTTADAPVRRFLARHPAGGGYLVVLNDAALDARRSDLQALGVRLVSDLAIAGYQGLQVHPRDAGACMLEFNHTQGGEAWDGPYLPAGDDWQARAAARSAEASITGLAGLTLQADDAQALAARWSALLGRPLAPGAVQPRLDLDGGHLAFATGPEGLVQVDLATRDAHAVLARAAALDLPVTCDAQGAPLIHAAGVAWKISPPSPR